ncbi:unnamed protein product [Thlaspi arvense]|uniref:Uncharacterized protein n=1 Tax=Thlaspi arvense TaxID=13288 RepID=A0AAU9T1U3_THLAR|nr:unnamed protein product [Thlaspi arvense]
MESIRLSRVVVDAVVAVCLSILLLSAREAEGECDLANFYFISGPCVTIDDCKKSCMEISYSDIACLGEVGYLPFCYCCSYDGNGAEN